LTESMTKINKLRERLSEKFGQEILDFFDIVYKDDAGIDLASIGSRYGFSKAHASQLFKKLYGMSYREARLIMKESAGNYVGNDISRGEKRLFVTIPVETDFQLRKYIRRKGTTKAYVVRAALKDFLEKDGWNRVEF